MTDPLSPIRLTTAYFILYCITVHVYTGICLLISDSAAGSTTVSEVVFVFDGADHAAVAFLVAATTAMFGLKISYPWNVICLLPQQSLLILASIGIGMSVYDGMFADGVIRSRAFLSLDHCELPAMCAFHAGVLVMRASLSSRLGPGLFFHPLEKVGLS